jgi:S-DNA-T family DNA segregation ATPase FtsK/SpoIIIE
MWLIPALALGVLSTLAVLSFSAADDGAWNAGRATHNWIGPVGHGLAWALFHAVGISAYGVAAMILTATILAVAPGGTRLASLATFGWVLVGFTVSSIAHLIANADHWQYPPGGAVGRFIGDAARGAFSLTGSLILLAALLLMAILLATRFAAGHAFEYAARGVGTVSVTAAKSAVAAYTRHRNARLMRAEEEGDEEEFEDVEAEEEEPPAPMKRLASSRALALIASNDRIDGPVDIRAEPMISHPPAAKKPAPPTIAEPPPAPRLVLPDVPPDTMGEARPKAKKKSKADAEPAPAVDPDDYDTDPPTPAAAAPIISEPPAPPKPTAQKSPAIVEPRPPPKPMSANKPVVDFQMANGNTSFKLPVLQEILEGETHTTRKIDRAALTATAEKLRQKLIDLGVTGEVTEIRPGPVVTMYEFKPSAGIKLSRIASLSDDLAMAMEALRVRIVAPIPGKGVVGFEVPNKTREMVFLKEVVEQEAFQKSSSRLAMAVGKDIEGLPYVADLVKMPHLLIAGTTGSGKSVGVNSMLVSMLMRATPEELRFIMVDPKMLELSIYEGIPHLLLPVVTDPKKAALSLRWAVEEMERRYALLADAGVRNIQGYNKIIEKEIADRNASTFKPIQLALPDGENAPEAAAEEEQEPRKKLPYIVIVIDELADLMMVAAKEVEVYIARLAQMARASGIHLMVATQRPSTDVLTGVIKANFPSRISFQVASRHDSSTIINTPGAENLLGQGDMLIQPPGTSSLTRVHGAYVSENEINRLTDFWKSQGAPVYDPEILRPRGDEEGEGGQEDEVADELYDQAIAAVSTMEQISISLLQRKMRIGYNRAARMIERMERDGLVGPADGAKPREVLVRGIGDMPGA